MPDQIHPLLLEDERAASGEAAPASEQETPPEAVAAPVAEETAAASTPPSGPEAPPPLEAPPPPPLYQLRKGQGLYQDIAALYDEDEEFKRRLSEFMGRKTKREYEVKMRELEAERDALLRAQRVREVEAMPPEEVDRRYRSDPQFAREYTDLVHGEPVDPEAVSEATYYEVTRDEEFDNAARFLSTERIKDYDAAFVYCPIHKTDEHGFYDHDEAGRNYVEQYGEKAGRMMAFDRFRKLITSEVQQAQRILSQRRTAPPPPPPPVPQVQAPERVAAGVAVADDAGNPNPALTEAAPDISNGSRPQAGRVKYTREEVRNMTWEQRFALWPNDGDYERAVEAGEVSIPGVNASE